jgi:hypothetical protein
MDPPTPPCQHRCIKLSLSHLVRGNEGIISAIDKLVILNSQIAVRGSMILNLLAVHCSWNNRSLPTLEHNLIYQAFASYDCINIPGYIKDDQLRRVVLDVQHLIPLPFTNADGSIIMGKSWLIGYLVEMYQANIKASIVLKWKSVVSNSIDSHLAMFKPDLSENKRKTWWKNIYKRITRPVPKPGTPNRLDSHALRLVKFHRDGFGVEDDSWINDNYMKFVNTQGMDRITRVIGHFSQCLRRQCMFEDIMGQPNSLKKNMALPVFHVGRISIQIDKKGLYYVLNQYNSSNPLETFDLGKGGDKNFSQHLFKKYMNKLFCINELIHAKSPSKMFRWSGVGVTTDGVKSSLHYSRVQSMVEQVAPPVAPGQYQIQDDVHQIQDDVANIDILDEDDMSVNEAEIENFIINDEIYFEDGAWTEVTDDDTNDSSVASIVEIRENDMILSNDPGRSNIMYIIAFDAQKRILFVKTLTRRFYYHQAGINKAQKQSNKWNTKNSSLMEGRSKHHFKTSDRQIFTSSIAFYGENFTNLWNTYAVTKKWSLQNFLLYCSKNSVLDKFLEGLKLNVDADGYKHCYDRNVMLYGDGSFPSGGRGEQSVPLKYVKKRCTLFFECHDVNEYRTSQICPDCQKCRLLAVKKDVPGKKPDIVRGLKWCPSDDCRMKRLKDRDYVGAKNIMFRGLGIDTDNRLFDRKVHKWPSSTPDSHRFTPIH